MKQNLYRIESETSNGLFYVVAGDLHSAITKFVEAQKKENGAYNQDWIRRIDAIANSSNNDILYI